MTLYRYYNVLRPYIQQPRPFGCSPPFRAQSCERARSGCLDPQEACRTDKCVPTVQSQSRRSLHRISSPELLWAAPDYSPIEKRRYGLRQHAFDKRGRACWLPTFLRDPRRAPPQLPSEPWNTRTTACHELYLLSNRSLFVYSADRRFATALCGWLRRFGAMRICFSNGVTEPQVVRMLYSVSSRLPGNLRISNTTGLAASGHAWKAGASSSSSQGRTAL